MMGNFESKHAIQVRRDEVEAVFDSLLLRSGPIKKLIEWTWHSRHDRVALCGGRVVWKLCGNWRHKCDLCCKTEVSRTLTTIILGCSRSTKYLVDQGKNGH